MDFKIGEHVVHPQYGVGYVVNLEDRAFEPGVIRQYYEVAIPGGSTVWVPVSQTGTGLRKLATRDEIARCRVVLQSRPSALAGDARMRQSELTAHLKMGTITAQCEVVRDLAGHGAHKAMIGTIAGFLRAAQDVLAQEWAVVEGTTEAAAAYEISGLLEKSRLSVMEADPSELPQADRSATR